MSIDLVLWANTKSDLSDLGRSQVLFTEYEHRGKTIRQLKDGLEWTWWGSDGTILRVEGEWDADGNEIVAPVALPGFFIILRVHGEFFEAEKYTDTVDEDGDPIDVADRDKVWGKLRFIRKLKKQATPGQVAGVNYYEVGNIRIFHYPDVLAKCEEWGVAGHVFA